MSLRPPAGFIRPGYDPLEVPNAPTDVSASAGDASASVAFTAPADAGGSAITAYYAVSNPGQITGTGASSPVSVTGLTNGTSYTFSVWALNSYGPSGYSRASGSITPLAATIAFGGGRDSGGSAINNINYITVATTGDASDWGDLTVARYQLAGCASSTRGVFIAGSTDSQTNVMDYITFTSQGNAVDFGDVQNPDALYSFSAASNSTRGIITRLDDIFYITIATTGNSATFGNWGESRGSAAMAANETRAVVFAGVSANNTMDYVTIATTGSVASFGSITGLSTLAAGASSDTRGIVFGGRAAGTGSDRNVIEYITFASTGNATDFGDLTVARQACAAGSSKIRGVCAGGLSGSSRINVMDYITIASTGDATDFGDLLVQAQLLAGASNASGGV